MSLHQLTFTADLEGHVTVHLTGEKKLDTFTQIVVRLPICVLHAEVCNKKGNV